MTDGFEEVECRADNLTYDEASDGVWIGDRVFLPRNVVLWAEEVLRKGGRKNGPSGAGQGAGAVAPGKR